MILKPSDVYYSQDSISKYFDKKSRHYSQTIGITLDEIIAGKCSVHNIPKISVLKIPGGCPNWFSVDNRRLWVFKELERIGFCDQIEVNQTVFNSSVHGRKLTTKNGGTSIKIRAGGDPGGTGHKLPNNYFQRFKSMLHEDQEHKSEQYAPNRNTETDYLERKTTESTRRCRNISLHHPPDECLRSKVTYARNTERVPSSILEIKPRYDETNASSSVTSSHSELLRQRSYGPLFKVKQNEHNSIPETRFSERCTGLSSVVRGTFLGRKSCLPKETDPQVQSVSKPTYKGISISDFHSAASNDIADKRTFSTQMYRPIRTTDQIIKENDYTFNTKASLHMSEEKRYLNYYRTTARKTETLDPRPMVDKAAEGYEKDRRMDSNDGLDVRQVCTNEKTVGSGIDYRENGFASRGTFKVRTAWAEPEDDKSDYTEDESLIKNLHSLNASTKALRMQNKSSLERPENVAGAALTEEQHLKRKEELSRNSKTKTLHEHPYYKRNQETLLVAKEKLPLFIRMFPDWQLENLITFYLSSKANRQTDLDSKWSTEVVIG